MAWSYTFSACKNPAGDLEFAAKDYLRRVMSTLAIGEAFVVTLQEFQDKRTNRQLRGLWGPIYTSIVEFLLTDGGYRRDEWPHMKELIHDGLAGLYGGYVTCPITKTEVRKFRVSTATKQELADYMNWLAQYMAEEHHFVVQMPGEQ